MKNQTGEFLTSIIREPEAFEQLPGHIRQQLVENPIPTMARLAGEPPAKCLDYTPISDTRIVELAEKAAAVGGHIHILRRVRVQPDRPWQEAVREAGPDTGSQYEVWRVGNQYQPLSSKVWEDDIVLLNFPCRGEEWDAAVAWGKTTDLSPTNPRAVFAIPKQYPELLTMLGHDEIDMVATSPCSDAERDAGKFYACHVWWNESERSPKCRKSFLHPVDQIGGPRTWFAFEDSISNITITEES